MLELLNELFRYQSWADAQIVAAVKACPPAAEDEQLRTLLHHIVVVQRFFVGQALGDTFDENEMRVPATLEEIERLFSEAGERSARFLAELPPEQLGGVLDRPPLQNMRPTIATALMQSVLHSQHHRGQVATRLRALGGSPPTVDYIIWKGKHA